MLDTPQQNWSALEAKTRAWDATWLRGLTSSDRFALYADLFNVIWNAPDQTAKRQRLDRWSWQQKLSSRLQMVEAFNKLDRLNRERTAEHHTG